MKIRVIIWDAAQEARRSHTVGTVNPVLADYVVEYHDLAQRCILNMQCRNAFESGQSVTIIPTGE